MKHNILDSDADAIVNTTNVQGVMGAGLAYYFAKAYPKMLEYYRLACADGTHKMGEMLFFNDDSGKIICNFPTMKYPGMRANLDDIVTGLRDLKRAIVTSQTSPFHVDIGNSIHSIAIPPLGCGIGRLDYALVKAAILEHLAGANVDVQLYLPEDAGVERIHL